MEIHKSKNRQQLKRCNRYKMSLLKTIWQIEDRKDKIKKIQKGKNNRKRNNFNKKLK
jgi:hypothetical protein